MFLLTLSQLEPHEATRAVIISFLGSAVASSLGNSALTAVLPPRVHISAHLVHGAAKNETGQAGFRRLSSDDWNTLYDEAIEFGEQLFEQSSRFQLTLAKALFGKFSEDATVEMIELKSHLDTVFVGTRPSEQQATVKISDPIHNRMHQVVHEVFYKERERQPADERTDVYIVRAKQYKPLQVPLDAIKEAQWRISQQGPTATRADVNIEFLAGIIYNWFRNFRRSKKKVGAHQTSTVC